MSSGTPYNPGGVRGMIQSLANKLTGGGRRETSADAQKRLARLGLSPRQQRLNDMWAWYRCQNYDARKLDWNGQEVADPIDHEAIASAGFLPPGFYDAGETMPIKFRKPTAPYRLVKVIVDRFTGLLFSERHHPQVHVDGDQDTEQYVSALIEQARLWPKMIQVRSMGGAMGVACVGFQFVDGKLMVETHDPRWVVPKFIDRHTLQLRQIEKRYMYPEEERNAEGIYETVWYWYRRIIDQESDILFKPAPVGDGEEPDWEIDKKVDHKFGFCPVVWVQNQPIEDDIDGDPDCNGVYDAIKTIDALQSQANRGTIANSDPTVVIKTEMEYGEVQKGSGSAIKVEPAGSAEYMEMSGAGPKTAMELGKEFRRQVLEVAQCILEPPNMSNRTADEVEKDFASMISKADTLREQYGERCVKPLVEMMILAVKKFRDEPDENGQTRTVILPPKVVKDANGGESTEEHKLGDGGVMTLKWPRYFDILVSDVELAVRAAGMAKTLGLLDSDHAIRFVAEYFRVEDVRGMRQIIDKEQAKLRQQAMQGTMDMLKGTPTSTPSSALGMGKGLGLPKMQGLGSPPTGKKPAAPGTSSS